MKARQIKTSSCRVKLRHDQIETLQRQIKMKTLYADEMNDIIKSTESSAVMKCDIYNITMIQEQLNEERAMKIDQQPIRSFISHIVALSVSTLLIITGGVLLFHYHHHEPHHHHHRQPIDNFIANDLQSTITTDLSISVGVGRAVISMSPVNIPYSLSGPSKDVTSSSAFLTISGNNNISPLERQALENLYDSTDGPNWNYLYDAGIPWDFFNLNTNPCDELWYGITCSVDYHVVDLSLEYSNLRGTIPATIGQLSFLEYLYLQSNQLTGTIPSTIGQLFSLEYIFLYDNKLTGVVPVSPCQIDLRYKFFEFQNDHLQCYPECFLLRSVLAINAGSIPVCAKPSDQPITEPSTQPISLMNSKGTKH